MRFLPEFLNMIKARIPLSRLLAPSVTFDMKKSRPAQGDFWACCPFHAEKTPSFHCNDRQARFYCFGCKATGDHFALLMRIQGLSFFEAVVQLAQQVGVPLPKDEQGGAAYQELETLYNVMEQAAVFFETQLQKAEGQGALSYLQQRQIAPQWQKSFRLGYAPNKGGALQKFLLQKGFTHQQMERCGLVGRAENGRLYDWFRGRVIFPIKDLRGRVVAFGSRALVEGARAKYLNSPETELFQKREMLYNAKEAREACYQKTTNTAKPLILVEGYMDVIALTEAGIKNVCAPLGTAVTEAQLELAWRLSPQIILCFDGDGAGFMAARRVMEKALPLLRSGVSIQFVLLPDEKDPDDLIKEEGAQAMQQCLEEAQSLADFLWHSTIAGRNFRQPEERAQLEQELFALLETIKDKTLRYYYQKNIREQLYNFFRPAIARKALGKKASPPARFSVEASDVFPKKFIKDKTLPLREALILGVLRNYPLLWEEVFDQLSDLHFKNPALAQLHSVMLAILAENSFDLGQNFTIELQNRADKGLLLQLEEMLKTVGVFPLEENAAPYPLEKAKKILLQAVFLQRRSFELTGQLKEIEQSLIERPDSANFALLKQVKAELEKLSAMPLGVESV